MSEKIYRAMKKATLPRREQPSKYLAMSDVYVGKRGNDTIMVATDARILIRVDFPETKLRRKVTPQAGFPNFEDPTIFPTGGVSAVFDTTLLRKILDVADAVRGENAPLVRLTVVGRDKAAKIETADERAPVFDPRMTAHIMPVVTEARCAR